MAQHLSKKEVEARRRARAQAEKTPKGPSRNRQVEPSRDRSDRKEPTK